MLPFSSSVKGPSPLSADSPNSAEPRQAAPTRGKALIKQASVTQRLGTSGIIANARTWGVQLVQLDKFLEKIKQYGSKENEGTSNVALYNRTVKQSSKPKVRKLNAPFIKVEDLSHHYKPLVHELKEWPRIYLETPVGTCPFDPPKQEQQEDQVKQRSNRCITNLLMVFIKRSRDHKMPLNSRYHFFDSRNGSSSVMLVKCQFLAF